MENEKKEKLAVIEIYTAIEQMKRITEKGGTFSIRFRKMNRQSGQAGEPVYIPAARLAPKASDQRVRDASHKLFLTDTETGQARICWQPLVVEFNGMRTYF